MNLIEKVCKELGVEIGEEWLSTDGNSYCILSDGLIEVNGDSRGYQYWGDIFRRLVKPVWKPKEGEVYYVPNPTYLAEMNRFDRMEWDNDLYDKWTLENNLVFKTKEEAVEAANKMLQL